ncbi:hypothetical protein GCM10009641_70520 [Mycobacterium cookii]|uniref:TetR family transcriptional regulator n=1 Tax=Nocardioides furvisabuli TaxID=375542 RepID=A0ABN2WS19_9ACTN|nr:hypothetical protein [Nocardioides furvisabuli]
MDADNRFIPRSGPMFSRSSPAKAQMATDLAIPILADGGWPALTLRNVAAAANVTPQAIAAWFPSVAAMRAAVAAVYGDRWIRERDNLARTRTFSRDRVRTSSDVAEALLPQSWNEDVYDGIWLTIVEAGRWDETVGAAVATVQDRERDLVRRLLEPSWPDEVERLEREVDLVLAAVRGLRASYAPLRSGTTTVRAGSVLAGLAGAG